MELHVTSRPPFDEGPGNDHVLVAVHGAMDRSTSFRRLGNHLLDWGMVTYDRRGYADSLGVAVTEDFDAQVQDLVDVVGAGVPDATGPGAGGQDGRGPSGGVVALGHSFGGNVVLAAAARHPDLFVAAVVFEPPALWTTSWPSQMLQGATPADQAEAFFRRLAGDRVWGALSEDIQALRRSEGPALVCDMVSLRHGRPFDPAEITIPVVVGYGGRSSPSAADWARQLASELPNSQLVEVPEAEHGIHVGHPSALADLVRSAAKMAG